jgi:hypothetical protein
MVDCIATGEPVGAPLAQADAVTPALPLDHEEGRTGGARRERERGKKSDREEKATHQH